MEQRHITLVGGFTSSGRETHGWACDVCLSVLSGYRDQAEAYNGLQAHLKREHAAST